MARDGWDRRLLVLVVVENKVLASSLRRFLSISGLAVDLAATDEAGLASAGAANPDVIVIDTTDPCRLTRGLRARRIPSPILVLSIQEDPDHVERALDAGADDYLVKPFAQPELLARIRALGRRHFAGRWQ